MRAIPIYLLAAFLSCVTLLWAGDNWESASQEAVLKADWRSVAEITREWKEREPDSAVAHWLAGYAGLATGDYRLATDGFGRLNKPESFSQLREWAASLAADNPRNAVPLMLQGDALARAGKYADAIAFLDKAVSLDPHSALTYNARGVVRALADRPQEAMADFTEATRLSPQFADAYANQGLLHLVQDEHQQALANFSAAIEHAPDFALAYHDRGIARMQTNDYDGALADLERTGQLPALGSAAWLETNRQSVLREQARFTLQQHLADLRSGHSGNDSMSFNYDTHGKLTSLRDVFGGEMRYGYDPTGRVSRITYPDGKWTEYHYYDNGYLRELQTESGRRISYTHGAKGEWTQIEIPNKDVIRIEQDPIARSVSFSFPDGDTTRYQFDQQQRLVEVRTANLTRTNVYDSASQLREIKWSDGRTVDFQSDTDNQIRSIRDQAGHEMRQWDVTLRTDEHGWVASMTDPLERTRLQWDDAGRLRSAISDSGSKVLVHWNSETNTPRSLTTSWGSVEFDAQGRPQDLYTIEGQRWPATWKADGQLEQVMTPLFGAIRFRSETSNRSIAIQFPDGLSTRLDWDKRGPARMGDAGLSQRDRESVRFSDPPRPLSSMPFGTERALQYRFEMPQLPADRLMITHNGRFWSQVQELLERSAHSPMPGNQGIVQNEEYWTKGEFWKDPYYADLARPTPEFSAQSYAKAFVLTAGVIALDWTRFALQVSSGPEVDPAIDFLIKPLVERIPVVAQNPLMQQLKVLDSNGDITRGLDPARKNLEKLGSAWGAVRFVYRLFLTKLMSVSLWNTTEVLNPATGETKISFVGAEERPTILPQYILTPVSRIQTGLTVHATPLKASVYSGQELLGERIGKSLDFL